MKENRTRVVPVVLAPTCTHKLTNAKIQNAPPPPPSPHKSQPRSIVANESSQLQDMHLCALFAAVVILNASGLLAMTTNTHCGCAAAAERTE